MKVLVTGGAGFIGSHIVDLLVEKGYQPVVVDNLSSSNLNFLPNDVPFYKEDISSIKLEEIFKKERPEIVIHQAAQVDVSKSMKDPINDAKSNILGTLQVLSCCEKFSVKKIIYASSCAVYGDAGDCMITEGFPIKPISHYGISKYVPEIYIKHFNERTGLPYMILRYANVYGPRQSSNGEAGVVSIFMQSILKGKEVSIYGDGEQTRDFVFVKDVALANILAIEKDENETVNISCNSKTSINNIYKLIKIISSKHSTANFQISRSGDIRFSRLDNSRASNIMEWKPKYDLLKGMKETLNYYTSENENEKYGK